MILCEPGPHARAAAPYPMALRPPAEACALSLPESPALCPSKTEGRKDSIFTAAQAVPVWDSLVGLAHKAVTAGHPADARAPSMHSGRAGPELAADRGI